MGAAGRFGYVDPALHHADGTHRKSPRVTNGSEVAWFDKRIRQHLEQHKEKKGRKDERSG